MSCIFFTNHLTLRKRPTHFILHVRASIYAPGPMLFDRFVFGVPAFAPMLFLDLVLLALIGLWALRQRLHEVAVANGHT